jgi:hypothetical protein
MSKAGIELTAQVFSAMQEARVKLLGMKGDNGEIDKQDIVLGQMLGDMNDAFKNRFMQIASGKLYAKDEPMLSPLFAVHGRPRGLDKKS